MPISHDAYPDALLRDILASVKRIAVVGASAKPDRPSFGVMAFLKRCGFEVLAVNPGLTADAIPGIATYARLADIPGAIDMVDVFRLPAAGPGVVDEVLALDPLPAVLWMQLGLRDDEAAARAEARGLRVVMNRCPAIEIPRLAAPTPASRP